MRKAYWFLIAFFIWAFIFWYHFVFKQQAPAPIPVETPPALVNAPAPTIPNQEASFLFKPNEYELIGLTASSEQIKVLLSEGTEHQILQITGYNSPEEEKGLDFDLGQARASELKKLLIDQLAESKIEIFSDRKSNFTKHQDSLIAAVSYEWVDGPVPEDLDEAIPEVSTNDNYFLIDHDSKRVQTDKFEAMLEQIAQRLKSTGESVIIRGHTDSDGKSEINFTVAHRNAKDIRDVFRKKGVKRGKITTTSRGDEAPLNDNSSNSDKLKNRRIELEIR